VGVFALQDGKVSTVPAISSAVRTFCVVFILYPPR
jgi:hypothetical protein